jgi:hypothetical protein
LRMWATLLTRKLGRPSMPCEASGIRTRNVSTLSSFSAV